MKYPAQKKTVLYTEHKNQQGKMIEFGEWVLPIQFQGVLKEHNQVRNCCGIFDVSHMGEIRLTGKEAKKAVQYLTFNDVNRLAPGKGQYSGFVNTTGGLVDDIIVYQIADNDFLICVNAANTRKNLKWLMENCASFRVEIHDQSDSFCQIAVQGPKSREVLSDLGLITPNENLAFMEIKTWSFHNQQGYLARTGYTGELGYEAYLPQQAGLGLWQTLLNHPLCKPIGLGARDTLRLESCYLLYGKDMNESVSPLEAGISWAVKLDTEAFIGRDALIQQKQKGVPRKLVCFLMEEKAIARSQMEVYFHGQKIGHVTSGSFLPSLENSGGMALIETGLANLNDSLEIDIRGKRKLAKIVKRPLYLSKVK